MWEWGSEFNQLGIRYCGGRVTLHVVWVLLLTNHHHDGLFRYVVFCFSPSTDWPRWLFLSWLRMTLRMIVARGVWCVGVQKSYCSIWIDIKVNIEHRERDRGFKGWIIKDILAKVAINNDWRNNCAFQVNWCHSRDNQSMILIISQVVLLISELRSCNK